MGLPHIFCSRVCHGHWDSLHKRGVHSPVWKGGRYLNAGGYVVRPLSSFTVEEQKILIPMAHGSKGQFVLEHRAVCALFLQRSLASNEHVNHTEKARDKADNRIEVLELRTPSGHVLKHWHNEKAGRAIVRLLELAEHDSEAARVAKLIGVLQP
jgi:hypothetical protein